MAMVADSGGSCAANIQPRQPVNGSSKNREQDDFIDALGGEIGRSYEGLYLPGSWTSMYVCPDLKNYWDMLANDVT